MADDALNPETPPLDAKQPTVEATVESTAHGGAESSCNHYNLETSGLASDVDRNKSLEEAEDLMERGSMAAKENDYTEATECYSRALEIRLGFGAPPFFVCGFAFIILFLSVRARKFEGEVTEIRSDS